MWARYYDPRINIWASVDPLVEKTFSSYGYCNLNPVRYIDKRGLKSESTHIDKNGNVVAVINDGDLNIYKHTDNEIKNKDFSNKNFNRIVGVIFMKIPFQKEIKLI
ncbi:RHS repeat domain-containing protein [Flavobacterium branchiophilum]|uniref:RHS repeat domain-containing protein n=1 Tax=Flavobacterium branchiophilum TaxID=55197 RepID=UPI0016810CDE|nr:RHS repeat-associated core domain-containing protein [Flavobacterium branchiophilum]